MKITAAEASILNVPEDDPLANMPEEAGRTRPIVIVDEPQSVDGGLEGRGKEALDAMNPLCTLRYSATHRTQHNRIHRLDALDAYNQKLVKKIAVRGIQTRGLAGTNAYLYLEGIDISRKAPVARIELRYHVHLAPPQLTLSPVARPRS